MRTDHDAALDEHGKWIRFPEILPNGATTSIGPRDRQRPEKFWLGKRGKMGNRRRTNRIDVDIPVVVATVLETVEASIVDLSERGARIYGVSLLEGTRFRLDYMGHTVFAQCRWTEVDRLGAKFLFELTDGPLYERLQVARATHGDENNPTGLPFAMAPFQQGQVALGARTFGRAMIGGQFGRRN